MGLRLIIEDVEGATTIVPLAEQEVTIGRKGGNTIQLTEQNVSRNHARLSLVEGNWQITDLSSYNGVLVNGAPLVGETVVLQEGDLIQIGDPQIGYVGDGGSIEYSHFFDPATDDSIEISSIDSVAITRRS